MNEIAIVGISCLFPEANNTSEFWEIIKGGKDVTSELNKEDLGGKDPSIYYHPEPGTPDKIKYTQNGYLRGFTFDSKGYRLPPEKLQGLDRLHHFCLYVAREALKDSGYLHKEEVLSQTGLILGNLSFATEYSSRLFSGIHLQSLEFFLKKLLDCPQFSFASTASHSVIDPENAITASGPADVVCKSLGLGGLRYAIDAACATSLYVMDLASYYLNTGQTKMMLAGAVCTPERIHVLHGFNVLQAFPDKGKSIPLDRASEGIKIGEGAGIFVLKRLIDAEKDGDNIYAVIENVGLSNDGAGKHILSPSQKGQYLALQKAYGNTPLADYIECHATGTPLGDNTEINTLEKFFLEKHVVCRIGANKANQGHLLTASGMVSLIKGIKAMKECVIPPTIGIEKGITSEQGIITSEQIVQTLTPWPKMAQPKRVGINAFGFGGTNAHLILREYIPSSSSATPKFVPQANQSLAIVGMDIHIGPVEGLSAFSHTLYNNLDLRQKLPPSRWLGVEESLGELPPLGVYLEKFDLDCLRYKIPPKEVSSLLFDHLFMLKIADEALRNAGFKKDEFYSNTAVIIAMETNLAVHQTITRLNMPTHLRQSIKKLNLKLTEEQIKTLECLLKDCISPNFSLQGITGGIGNLAASRIASLWDFTGPTFTLSARESSVAKAIEIAKFLLTSGKVNAVVVGALDQSGGWEQTQWRKRAYPPNDSFHFGEGAAAIVLMKTNDSDRLNHKIYATIDALSLVHSNSDQFSAPLAEKTAQKALKQAGITPKEVDYLEVCQMPPEGLLQMELDCLKQLYPVDSQKIGSINTLIGNTQVLSGLASLIKICLCLYHRRLPNFQLKTITSWKLKNDSAKRFAAIHSRSHDGTYSHFILQEADHETFVDNLQKKDLTPSAPKPLLKTLYTGSMRMDSLLLTEDNLREFKQEQLEIAKQSQLVPNNQTSNVLPLRPSPAFFDEQILIKSQLENLFLKVQSAFYQNLTQQLTSVQQTLAKPKPQSIVWDLNEILEITEGKISRVLGDYYQEMDNYPIRTRTPSPPFMFVSRVTKMTAKQGKLEPCYIEWEYDIPSNTFFAAHKVLTGLIPFEASHVLLLALAYIGCDLMFQGQLRYRALDSEVEFLGELPEPGETLRGEVFINKLIKTPTNLLLQYVYNCYHKGQQILKITANSGYFSQKDLQKPKGLAALKLAANEIINPTYLKSPLSCDKTYFTSEDIQALQSGKFEKCFGNLYKLSKPKDQLLSSHKLLMISRILKVDRQGGLWKLGQILGEVDIDPEHWIFQAHFKNDPVMPGTMLVEGCNQAALFYLYYLGCHTKWEEFKPTWICQGNISKAKFRGEVKKSHCKVQFRITVKQINNENDPYIITIAEVIIEDTIIGICDNLSVKLEEIKFY